MYRKSTGKGKLSYNMILSIFILKVEIKQFYATFSHQKN